MDVSPAVIAEKQILCAYLRMMGYTQEVAGKAIGRSKRTVRNWEKQPTWSQVRDQARTRWMNDVTDASRQTLLACIRGGAGDLALKVLERLDSDLAPPAQRLQHQHEVGEGLSGLLAAFGEAEHADPD